MSHNIWMKFGYFGHCETRKHLLSLPTSVVADLHQFFTKGPSINSVQGNFQIKNFLCLPCPQRIYKPHYDYQNSSSLANGVYFIHCNPLQGQYRARTGFSLCSISTQGKSCFHCRVPSWWKQVFPCWKYYTGKTLFSLQGWVCSMVMNCFWPFLTANRL